MLQKLLSAWFLLAVTVMIHAVGLTVLSRRLLISSLSLDTRFWPVTVLIIRVAWWLILLHLVEIAIWALFFWWQQCLPDLESSFYFSGVTYATVGYGDLVLPRAWRLLGPVEGLTGILMCGLSVGVFFAVFSKIFRVNAAVELK